jgi:hypothetical protein
MNPAVFLFTIIVLSLAILVWIIALEKAIRRERREIVEIIKEYKPLSPNPDVVYTKKAILAAIGRRKTYGRITKN